VNLVQTFLGLVLVLVSAGLLFVFSLPALRKSRPAFRVIPAFQKLRRAVGRSVEEGGRIHVSIGKSSIFSPTNTSALVGLSTLERIAQLSSVSDRPPVATSGDGTLSILSQDTLRAAYRLANAQEQYNPERGRMSGPTAFSYIAGTIPTIRSERVSTNILVGNFGPEAALLVDAADQQNGFTLAASDSLAAQAVLYVTAQEPLIGEELYAIPAYLQAGAAHQASLHVQDILRWVVIVLLILLSILAAVGVKIL
jgi:hypothetical protein